MSLVNTLTMAGWKIGIRSFRVARAFHLSNALEPAFVAASKLFPTAKTEQVATLPFGILYMPARYRDARTVIAGLFQDDETRLFQRLIRPGMTVLDIGAYVGYFTILFSRLVGPTGRVLAFEPNENAFEYLLRNIEANGCTNVTAHSEAVANVIGTAWLVEDPVGPESHLNSGSVSRGQSVATVRLDDIRDLKTVDVAKMNIEGGELRALQGMEDLSARSPQLQLVMEYNARALARAGATGPALANTLTELGFTSARIVERDLRPLQDGKLLPSGNTVYNIHLVK